MRGGGGLASIAPGPQLPNLGQGTRNRVGRGGSCPGLASGISGSQLGRALEVPSCCRSVLTTPQPLEMHAFCSPFKQITSVCHDVRRACRTVRLAELRSARAGKPLTQGRGTPAPAEAPSCKCPLLLKGSAVLASSTII